MKNLLALNKPGPGPGTYTHSSLVGDQKQNYKPVVVQCFFKGADKCSLCDKLLYGDYYKDKRRKRSLCWCLECYRFSLSLFPLSYKHSIKKHRHCNFFHKHIDVENIVYHLVPEGRLRRLFLKEKAMWSKYGEMRDHKGLPK